MPDGLKARGAAAEVTKQQKEAGGAHAEALKENELRTGAQFLEKKMRAAQREAEEAELEIMAIDKRLSSTDLSAQDRAQLEQIKTTAQMKAAELERIQGELDIVQTEIDELNQPEERDVAIDGKFLGREVKQFDLVHIAGGSQMGGDAFSEVYLETGSGNIYKIYSDDGGATFKLVDAKSNKGAGLNVKGAALSTEDLATTLKVGEQFKYSKNKELNTSPITKITVVNTGQQYAEGVVPGKNSDVSSRFKEALRPEKKSGTTTVDAKTQPTGGIADSAKKDTVISIDAAMKPEDLVKLHIPEMTLEKKKALDYKTIKDLIETFKWLTMVTIHFDKFADTPDGVRELKSLVDTTLSNTQGLTNNVDLSDEKEVMAIRDKFLDFVPKYVRFAIDRLTRYYLPSSKVSKKEIPPGFKSLIEKYLKAAQ